MPQPNISGGSTSNTSIGCIVTGGYDGEDTNPSHSINPFNGSVVGSGLSTLFAFALTPNRGSIVGSSGASLAANVFNITPSKGSIAASGKIGTIS